ncbi:hypothetical protein OIA45_45735 (plasmid) [Streptomyces chartreusis]|uniref:hypothetical protein n=1 Tax=Streptomyces chartreusis TaxID=1969 RepID=UPI002F91AC29|nr:hypothetical protein OIA45_45735 [Streptomyces chartreusis]
MADAVDTTQIQERYAPQLAADLEKNLAAQKRLREEEAWLRTALGSMPEASVRRKDAPNTTPTPEDSATVQAAPFPQPRQQEDSTEPQLAGSNLVRSKGVTNATAKKTRPTTTARRSSTPRQASRRSGGPTLGELVLTILSKTPDEPRTTTEVTEDLAREYPDRARDANNVRNALEALVAKSLIERTKQKKTVHYTVLGLQDTPEPTRVTEPDTSRAAEAASDEETQTAAASA